MDEREDSQPGPAHQAFGAAPDGDGGDGTHSTLGPAPDPNEHQTFGPAPDPAPATPAPAPPAPAPAPAKGNIGLVVAAVIGVLVVLAAIVGIVVK